MATGLLIRDFNKNYRESRYANEGSFRLTEVEHNAYLNRLTLEITHYNAYRSVSYKTNPDNTHWGYLTSFKGSAVSQNLPIKFAKQRVFELINQGIWDYHQAAESLNLSTSVAEASLNTFIVGGVFGEATDTLLRLYIEAKDTLTDALSNNAAWLVGNRSFNEGESIGVNYSYTAFPIASPFPDVFKFKSDIPCSFLFRLESWYLVNPAVYIVSNPTDTSDETEGEEEYPKPDMGDGSGSNAGFPPSSAPDPANNPRDYEADPGDALEPSTSYVWSGNLSGTLLGGSGTAESYEASVNFTAQGNQFPFTAKAGPSIITTVGGENWYRGIQVFDRLGQLVGHFYTNVGFRVGTHEISVIASLQQG